MKITFPPEPSTVGALTIRDTCPDWNKTPEHLAHHLGNEAHLYDPGQPRDPKGVSTGGQWTAVNRVSPRHIKAEDATTTLTLADLVDHPEALKAMVDKMKRIGALPPEIAKSKDPHKAADDAVNWMASNVEKVLDEATPEQTAAARQWYPAARKLAVEADVNHGTTESGAVAVTAIFSASTDWRINVANARFFMANMHRLDEPLDQHTAAEANKLMQIDYEKKKAAYDKAAEKAAKLGTNLNRPEPEVKDVFHFKEGVVPSSLSVLEQAMIMRAYGVGQPYELEIQKDGSVKETIMMTKNGKPSKGTWGTFSMISNAINAYRTPTYEVIQDALGGGSKVPSFFNNIMDPDNPAGDVTADTHAYAIALNKVLTSKHPWIMTGKENIYSSPDNVAAGTSGVYVLVAEAYRRVAAKRGMMPREVQSVTWEMWRINHSASGGKRGHRNEGSEA